jgi:hypothetical protein
MVGPGAGTNELVHRILPHRCCYINQCCCHGHKPAIKLWRKIIPLFYLGNMVVRRLYFLCLLLGWRSHHVRFWPCVFLVYMLTPLADQDYTPETLSGCHDCKVATPRYDIDSRVDIWWQFRQSSRSLLSTAFLPDTLGLRFHGHGWLYSRIDDTHRISHASHSSRSSLCHKGSFRFSSNRTDKPDRLCNTSNWAEFPQTLTIYVPRFRYFELRLYRDSC